MFLNENVISVLFNRVGTTLEVFLNVAIRL